MQLSFQQNWNFQIPTNQKDQQPKKLQKKGRYFRLTFCELCMRVSLIFIGQLPGSLSHWNRMKFSCWSLFACCWVAHPNGKRGNEGRGPARGQKRNKQLKNTRNCSGSQSPQRPCPAMLHASYECYCSLFFQLLFFLNSRRRTTWNVLTTSTWIRSGGGYRRNDTRRTRSAGNSWIRRWNCLYRPASS